jgi:hypothetical protein
MDITHRVKVVKSFRPKGGYCGCWACRSGNLIKYKHYGDEVDGIRRIKPYQIYGFPNYAKSFGMYDAIMASSPFK